MENMPDNRSNWRTGIQEESKNWCILHYRGADKTKSKKNKKTRQSRKTRDTIKSQVTSNRQGQNRAGKTGKSAGEARTKPKDNHRLSTETGETKLDRLAQLPEDRPRGTGNTGT